MTDPRILPHEKWERDTHEQLLMWRTAGYHPQLRSIQGGWILILDTHPHISSGETVSPELHLRFISAPKPSPIAAILAAMEVVK